MKVIPQTIFIIMLYHIIFCSIGSFMWWENMFFNFNEWEVAGRAVYIAFCTLFASLPLAAYLDI